MTQNRPHAKTRVARTAMAVALLTGSTALSVVAGPGTATAAPTATGKALTGKTIFLDPGHQGSSAGQNLSRQVPDGRGGTKDCQTSGATSVSGVKEHTVNWQITQLVKAGLESQGARVQLSRPDDTGWGGCVDQRAAAASSSGAAVAVSLHADSTTTGTDANRKGFHMIVPTLPIPDAAAQKAQSGDGREASTAMRDAFEKAGFTSANYAGVNKGLQTRSDIAAVNLTKVPAVFVEMGNLSNPTDAAALTGKDGQVKYAMAITNGILNYVRPGSGTGATTGTGGADGNGSVGTPESTQPQATQPPANQPGSTTPGSTTPGTTTPGAATTPRSTTPGSTPQSGDAADELGAVLPFVQQLLGTKDPEEISRLMLTQGQDASAQVLNAMLQVVYGLFGGKLPIG